MMQPRISMITLGVSDLNQSVAFYRDFLGFPYSEHSVENAVAFFELNGTWLSLFPKDRLAKDATIENTSTGWSGMTLSHNLHSEEEVNNFFEQLPKNVSIVKTPQKTDWGGHHGYFEDPDGYLWEIAYNPFAWVGPTP